MKKHKHSSNSSIKIDLTKLKFDDKISQNLKPNEPKKPSLNDYPKPIKSNGKNYLGEPLYQKLDWIRDMEQYNKNLLKFKEQLEIYEQIKMIRFIKNAHEKLIFRKLKITKK